MNSLRSHQSGSTLVVALIVLLLMALHALTSLNLGKSSLQILDNIQQQNQAKAAAQEAIDDAISHLTFTTTPGAVFPTDSCSYLSVSAPANSLCVDVNGDGKTVVVANLSPQPKCIRAAPVTGSSLDLSKPEDATCVVGTSQNLGIVGSNNMSSLCAETLWELKVQASEPVSETQVAVAEGVAVRLSTDSVAMYCP